MSVANEPRSGRKGPNDRGSLTLWGRETERHMLFAEHLTTEYRVKTEGRGRKVDEWKMRPDVRLRPRVDRHGEGAQAREAEGEAFGTAEDQAMPTGVREFRWHPHERFMNIFTHQKATLTTISEGIATNRLDGTAPPP